MEGLGDAYDEPTWSVRDPVRVRAGAALFAVGALGILAASVVATGTVNGLVGAGDVVAAQGLAGWLAGPAVPAMTLGVVTVLPASRRERAGALAGAAVCLLGLGLFEVAYPHHWVGALAFPTTLVYVAGGTVSFWYVFSAVADYRVRNAPADTVRLELKRAGETKTVEVSRDEYRRYRDAVASDGGETERVIREIEARVED